MKSVKQMPKMMEDVKVMKQESAGVKMISFAELWNLAINNFGTGLLIVAAFLLGMLSTEVRYLKKGFGGTPSAAAPTAQAPTNQGAAAPEQPLTDDQWKKVLTNSPFELGKKNAPITMIEFTDYQCPYCGRHYTETYGKLVEQYVKTGKMRIVFHDLPLPFHPNAKPGAIAARCAGQQGKYEQMHDKLFDSQQDWSNLSNDDARAKFSVYAKDLGLNAAKFESCEKDASVAKAIDDDSALAAAVGATGTPTFFVNKQKIVGAMPLSEFNRIIDAQLK